MRIFHIVVVFNEGISKNKKLEFDAKQIPPLNLCFTTVTKGALPQNIHS